MRNLDRGRVRPPARTVPIEVAEAWRDEAVAARRLLDETRSALQATQGALRQARTTPDDRPSRELEQTRSALEQTRSALEQTRSALEQTRSALEQARAELDEVRAAPRQDRTPEPAPEAPPDARVARLAADLANVRRHAQEAVANARRSEKIEGLRALAEVHDDLQRSLDAMSDRSGPWFAGHSAILGKVRSMLRQAGAVPVGSVGEPFDPRVHEAVGTAPGPANEIAQVDEIGFQLEDGALVRPARVRVGAGVEEVVP